MRVDKGEFDDYREVNKTNKRTLVLFNDLPKQRM